MRKDPRRGRCRGRPAPPRKQPDGPNTPALGVTDTVVGIIDLSKEPAHIEGRLLRLRKLVVQPGGVVLWHTHHDRPAIIAITKGTIVEYASTCSVPIVHGPGDMSVENPHDRALVA